MICEHCADDHATEDCKLRTPEQQAIMDEARKLQVYLSRGENGKTRRPGVERHLGQFINGTSGKGKGNARNFSAGWDRMKKR